MKRVYVVLPHGQDIRPVAVAPPAVRRRRGLWRLLRAGVRVLSRAVRWRRRA